MPSPPTPAQPSRRLSVRSEATRLREIKRLFHQGETYRDIGEQVGLTRQRVHQILKSRRLTRGGHPHRFHCAECQSRIPYPERRLRLCARCRAYHARYRHLLEPTRRGAIARGMMLAHGYRCRILFMHPEKPLVALFRDLSGVPSRPVRYRTPNRALKWVIREDVLPVYRKFQMPLPPDSGGEPPAVCPRCRYFALGYLRAKLRMGSKRSRWTLFLTPSWCAYLCHALPEVFHHAGLFAPRTTSAWNVRLSSSGARAFRRRWRQTRIEPCRRDGQTLPFPWRTGRRGSSRRSPWLRDAKRWRWFLRELSVWNQRHPQPLPALQGAPKLSSCNEN